MLNFYNLWPEKSRYIKTIHKFIKQKNHTKRAQCMKKKFCLRSNEITQDQNIIF